MSKKITERSRYLSYLLRHKPESANLTLDKEGWCDLAQLLSNTDFTLDEICEIVYTDAKGRYTLDEPHYSSAPAKKIRANQGHSTKAVDIAFVAVQPPDVLYHGTSEGAFYDIMNAKQIKPMSRQYVHLSEDLETAKSVGKRHGRAGSLVVLRIDAKAMANDGHEFFRSENGVWLTRAVKTKYISQEL